MFTCIHQQFHAVCRIAPRKKWAVGGTVKLKTEGAQKIRGTLLAADDHAVTVEANGTTQQIPVEEIVRGNLIAEGEKA